jgi:hypothetical protein
MGSENPIIGSNIIATATIYFMVLWILTMSVHDTYTLNNNEMLLKH